MNEADIATGLARASRECRFFPTPADIIERIPRRASVEEREEFDAEEAWDRFKVRFKKWHPDIGLDVAEETKAFKYALNQIGGFERFAKSEIAHENFVRKEFIEAHQRYDKTGGRLAPSREEAKQLIERLKVEQGEKPSGNGKQQSPDRKQITE